MRGAFERNGFLFLLQVEKEHPTTTRTEGSLLSALGVVRYTTNCTDV